MTDPLVQIAGLRLGFDTGAGRLEVLRGIDLDIAPGEVLALVGESGSGKSALGRSILNLHAPPFVPDRAHMAGSIRLRGEEVLGAGPERLRRLRATDAALISQDALSGLNPVVRVAGQVAEAARAADPALAPDAAMRAARAMLDAVGLGDGPGQRPLWRAYPHELSGGQRQRVMIALAAVRRPALLIADEPTTALDVTVQAQVLELLIRLQQETGMAMLFITHDLGVVARIAQRVAVAYAGQIVETAPVADLFLRPRHPYTAGLLASLPEAPHDHPPLTGHAPSLRDLPPGCAFAPRCPRATARCARAPEVRRLGASHLRCHEPLS